MNARVFDKQKCSQFYILDFLTINNLYFFFGHLDRFRHCYYFLINRKNYKKHEYERWKGSNVIKEEQIEIIKYRKAKLK